MQLADGDDATRSGDDTYQPGDDADRHNDDGRQPGDDANEDPDPEHAERHFGADSQADARYPGSGSVNIPWFEGLW